MKESRREIERDWKREWERVGEMVRERVGERELEREFEFKFEFEFIFILQRFQIRQDASFHLAVNTEFMHANTIISSTNLYTK